MFEHFGSVECYTIVRDNLSSPLTTRPSTRQIDPPELIFDAIRTDRIHGYLVSADFKLSTTICAEILILADNSYRSAPTLNALCLFLEGAPDSFYLMRNLNFFRLGFFAHLFTFSL